mmetsp:Transcript_35276/g.6354  ORF Transcript_35276/g.6354 Transcript_35276/m.6354 type:complete len:104 (-) Transcript_35276:1367-1678(-)
MNSKLFLGKVGMIIEGNSKYTQDEIPSPANAYEPSLGEYKINAILPLYINEQHWMVAQHRLKALLGWSMVVDVLAFETVQAKITPFMLLAKTVAQFGADHAIT